MTHSGGDADAPGEVRGYRDQFRRLGRLRQVNLEAGAQHPDATSPNNNGLLPTAPQTL